MDHKSPAADPIKTAAALRSQLNQMAAASQVLEHNTKDEKGRAYLAVINQSICRMLRIVSRMELSGRLDADDPVLLSSRSLDITQQMELLVERLKGILADIGISLTLSCTSHIYTEADDILLRQMLLELVSNLALVSTELTLTVATDSSSITFALHGNPPAEAQGRPTLPSVLEGEEERTSIDLARKIAELHGGSLLVAPEADGSLCFTASIPHRESSTLRFESPTTPWRTGGFDSVLVAMSQLLPSRSFLPENLG